MSGEKVGILTHIDVDGVCSAALATTTYPNAEVEFTEAPYLALRLHSLPPWDRLVVLDLGINPAQKEEVVEAFETVSKNTKVTYIDHHELPSGVTKENLLCDEVYHRADVSASELSLEYFEPPLLLENIALTGAIGDWQEDTPKMKELLIKHGERISRLETILMEQGLRASRNDPEYLSLVVQELAKGIWPSSIPEMMTRARSALKQERKVKEHTSENLKKINDKIALVNNVPLRATGTAATYAYRFSGAEVGIGAYANDEDHIRISMRRNEGSKIDLSRLIREATLKLGGTGGGHKGAVGGRIPINKFDDFLEFMKSNTE